jgi:hypothetical protein
MFVQTGAPPSSRHQSARYIAGTPPPGYFPGGPHHTLAHSQRLSGSPSRYRSLIDAVGFPGSSSAAGQAVASSSSALNRQLPSLPTRAQVPEIAEEDECPVCHRELPPRSLPNFEAAREAHITICIASHSSGGLRDQAASVGSPGYGGSSPPMLAPRRRTGMFPYTATEKDCVDSAECTICLEEFEVGVKMARLECLCRFHKHCIDAWWQRHPARCPMHQHDSHGY